MQGHFLVRWDGVVLGVRWGGEGGGREAEYL